MLIGMIQGLPIEQEPIEFTRQLGKLDQSWIEMLYSTAL